MKNYNAITHAYLLSAGLIQVRVKCAATGGSSLKNVTRDAAEVLKRQGRIAQV
jgi:hypothetical protein